MRRTDQLLFFAFDLLFLNGQSTAQLPLIEPASWRCCRGRPGSTGKVIRRVQLALRSREAPKEPVSHVYFVETGWSR